jgi:hypothetical protein
VRLRFALQEETMANRRETARRAFLRFVFFLGGAAVSYFVALGLPVLIGRNVNTLTAGIFFLVVIAIVYLFLNNRHTQALALRTDMVVPAYEEELYRSPTNYEGRVYAQIQGLVRQTEKEILVLTDPSTETPVANNAETRADLLDAYVQAIKDHKANFTYTRIIQVPGDHANWPRAEIVDRDLGKLTRLHCCKLLQLEEKLAIGPALTNVQISVLVIPVERSITVVVLDHRTIVVNVEALAHQSEGDRPYLETAIVVEDRAGDFGDAYHSYFQSLRARAQPLKRNHFS